MSLTKDDPTALTIEDIRTLGENGNVGRVNHTAELDEQATSRGLGEPPLVLVDLGVDQLGSP